MPPASSPKESAASSPKEDAASSPMLCDLTRARPWYMIGLPNTSSRVGPMDHEALPCHVMSCYMMLWYVYLCDQDRKIVRLVKTETAVRSSVFHNFKFYKTSLNQSFAPFVFQFLPVR